jgi:hypothetical protein
VIGVDPGNDGAFVALSATTGDIIAKHIMPTREPLGEIRIWPGMLLAYMSPVIGSHSRSTLIALEALPHHAKSKAAMRGMARGWGQTHAALERIAHPVIEVKAGNSRDGWQTALLGKIPKGGTKAAALNRARMLWPHESWVAPGCRTPHPGYVDAALIAHYALRRLREFQSR